MPARTRRRPTAKPRGRRRRRVPRYGLLGAVWALIAVSTAILAYTTTLLAYLLVALLAGVAAGLSVLAARAEARAGTGGTGSGGGAAKPSRSATSGGRRGSGPVIRCTATRKAVDDCGCARRHVRSGDGARRYGLPVGSPIKPRGRP